MMNLTELKTLIAQTPLHIGAIFQCADIQALADSHTALLIAAKECLENITVYNKGDELLLAKLKAACVDAEK